MHTENSKETMYKCTMYLLHPTARCLTFSCGMGQSPAERLKREDKLSSTVKGGVEIKEGSWRTHGEDLTPLLSLSDFSPDDWVTLAHWPVAIKSNF